MLLDPEQIIFTVIKIQKAIMDTETAFPAPFNHDNNFDSVYLEPVSCLLMKITLHSKLSRNSTWLFSGTLSSCTHQKHLTTQWNLQHRTHAIDFVKYTKFSLTLLRWNLFFIEEVQIFFKKHSSNINSFHISFQCPFGIPSSKYPFHISKIKSIYTHLQERWQCKLDWIGCVPTGRV